MLGLARQADTLGFESVWLLDHLQTMPEPIDAPLFESFTSLAAFAGATARVRLGQMVLCAGFRNPALTAKMVSTLDVMSGGRMQLGIGAGWKEDEWRAFGYGFPTTRERLAILRDQLEVISAMLAPGHAAYEGTHAQVTDAINEPRGLQRPRVPIMVGGNGPNVTWRLAARYADELNLDGLTPDELREALPVIRDRCREIGREPETLAVSVNIFADRLTATGPPRVQLLAEYRALGVRRVMGLVPGCEESDAALKRFAEDALSAGARLADRC
jgi:F420-dependent oxidoreductase-like protein